MSGGPAVRFGCALLLVAIGAPASASVLGPDAAAPVRAWTARLDGLQLKGTSINAGSVEVSLGSRCSLVLRHPDAVTCKKPTPVGDATACSEGWQCPTAGARRRALEAAGPIALPWRQATTSSGPRDRLLAVRDAVQQHLARHDQAAALAALQEVRTSTRIRPIEWLSLAPLLAASGDPGEAWTIVSSDALTALGPARLAVLRALVLIGPNAGSAVARAVATPDNAERLIGFASTLLALRAYEAAGDLAAHLRVLAPSCFEAYAAEAEAWTVLRRLERQKAVSEAALSRFAGDPRLRPIEEAYFIDHGKADVVQARLEKAVAEGTAEAGALKRLLSFYIRVEGRVARLNRFRRQADADPGDVLPNFFAGVLLHYEKGFAASSRYLSRVIGKVSDEPRLFIYLAMNAFNLGDRATAEATIARAETLDLEDPDVAYCVGEIFRDTDRARATRALARYWEMTRFTSDVRSVKQRRVWSMREALQVCVDTDTAPPCPGPWEHTFDSVALGLHPGAPE